MDKLPTELISAIAYLACTDGGLTGASLSRVSKRIRDATHSARFHSVSLASGPEQFRKFHNTYATQQRRLQDTHPCVRHLFFSILPQPPECNPIYRLPLPYEEIAGEYNKHFARLLELAKLHGGALCSLIQALASDLETFTFVRGEWGTVPTLHCTFPRLRELTLIDGIPEFLSFEDISASPSTPMFPVLERLHIAEVLHARPVELCKLAVHAPALTHLRCSGLHYYKCPTVDAIKVMSVPLATDDNKQPVYLFPNLRRVLVQPTKPKFHSITSMQEEQGHELAACVAETRPEMRLAVMPPHDPLEGTPRGRQAAQDASRSNAVYVKETCPERCVKRAREGWISRMEGKEDCWSEKFLF